MAHDLGCKSPAICVTGLNFGYRPHELVLENVDFSICQGQLVGCIGPNGGGKTTLLRLLMGFLLPDRGKIQLLGMVPRNAREALAYVPQAQRHDRLFPITAEDVVLMGLLSELSWTGRFSKKQRERAHQSLAEVGLESHAYESFGNLSGGQAQRVLMARALVSNPKILFLDEPTASVDPAAEVQIYELLHGLKGSRTIFMVTHDLQIAHRHVDTVVCVQRQVTLIQPDQLCEHFAMGLYHRLQPLGRRGAST